MPAAVDAQSSTATSENLRAAAGVSKLKKKYKGLRIRGFDEIKNQVEKEFGHCVGEYPAMIERQHVEMNKLCTTITEDIRSIDSDIKGILEEMRKVAKVAKKEEVEITAEILKEYELYQMDQSKCLKKFKKDLKRKRNTPFKVSDGKIGEQWAVGDEMTEDLSTTDTGSGDED